MPARTLSTATRLRRATGALATAATERMERTLPWFARMNPRERSWVGLIAQAGITAFVEWYADTAGDARPPTDVFSTAPRELVRAITLGQTVELVRTTIEVVEERVDQLAAPGDEHVLREAVLRYGREVAFASAQVYAQAAEARGAWDARLEALVVDSLLRGEVDDAVRSRAAALGWHNRRGTTVVVGSAPGLDPEAVVDAVQRAARSARMDVLAGVQADRLVVVLGGVADPLAAATRIVAEFGPGPVVVGPVVRDLPEATGSAAAALSGLRAVGARPDAPRPAAADDLLPERVLLLADEAARRNLVQDVAGPLGPALRDTLWAYFSTGSLEGAARRLFVHTNTVRYRLRRTAELCGHSPLTARGAYVLHTALALAAADATPAAVPPPGPTTVDPMPRDL